MGFFSRLFGRDEASIVSEAKPQHALLIYLKLSDDEFGEHDARERAFGLEDELEIIVAKQRAGELDGHEFGGGFCTIYLYGPDAQKLFLTTIGAIEAWKPARGSYVVRRFGEPGAREERVELG